MPKIKEFFTPRRLTSMAVLIALQIVLARFVGLQINEGLRISFETIPIIGGNLAWRRKVHCRFLSDLFGTLISWCLFSPLT